jgi:vitamin B12 transporter
VSRQAQQHAFRQHLGRRQSRLLNPAAQRAGLCGPNLAANYTVNEYTTVFGRIDNLLHERYQNPTGFDRPGLGVFGGIRVANR